MTKMITIYWMTGKCLSGYHTQPKMPEEHGLEPQLANRAAPVFLPTAMQPLALLPRSYSPRGEEVSHAGQVQEQPWFTRLIPPGANILCSNFKSRVLRVLHKRPASLQVTAFRED